MTNVMSRKLNGIGRKLVYSVFIKFQSKTAQERFWKGSHIFVIFYFVIICNNSSTSITTNVSLLMVSLILIIEKAFRFCSYPSEQFWTDI